MNEIIKDHYMRTLKEQSLLEPENRQTLLVRTNNVFVPEKPDVEYPAKLQELIQLTSPEGEVESILAVFDLMDGVNKIYPFKAIIGSSLTPSERTQRQIKGIRGVDIDSNSATKLT